MVKVTGSRFLQPKTSRFLQKVATLAQAATHAGLSRFLAKAPATASRFVAGRVSRFLGLDAPEAGLRRGRSLGRIVNRVPIVTKFMAFFRPETLTLDAPEPVHIGEKTVHHVTPAYNRRARRPRGLTLG